MRTTDSSVKLWKLFPCAVAAALCSVALPARAQQPNGQEDTTKACIDAYESAQESRKADQLIKARAELQVCAAANCPAVVQTDCTSWLGQVVDAVPSVILSAKLDDENVFDVSVSIDGKPVATQLDGKPVEIDPGLHTFVFQRPGNAPIEKKTIVAARDKGQIVAAQWRSPTPVGAAPPTGAPEAPVEKVRPVPALFYVLGGVTVAGFATFAGVGVSANSTKSNMERTCSPGCPSDQVSSLKTRYLIADIAAGVGAAGALGALVVFLTRPEHDKPAATVGLSTLSIAPLADGAAIRLGGGF